MLFKGVEDHRPYPEHGLTNRDWAEIPPTRLRISELVTTKKQLDLSVVLQDDSTYFGDLFAHVVEWDGKRYLEDGLHRALRAALSSGGDAVIHARVFRHPDPGRPEHGGAGKTCIGDQQSEYGEAGLT